MSNRTFCWLFVWVAATFGWLARIVTERVGETPALLMSAIGGGLLVAALERRISKNREDT